MEAGPPSSAWARQPEINNSRANNSQTAHRGNAAVEANHSSGAAISTLSVNGSKRAPHVLPPPARRASQPSAASLSPASRSTHQAIIVQPASKARISGSPAIALATVRPSARVLRGTGNGSGITASQFNNRFQRACNCQTRDAPYAYNHRIRPF